MDLKKKIFFYDFWTSENGRKVCVFCIMSPYAETSKTKRNFLIACLNQGVPQQIIDEIKVGTLCFNSVLSITSHQKSTY